MTKIDPGALVVLSNYVATQPPAQPFTPRRETLVYLKPSYRFRITEEETSDLAYGLSRMERLAQLGLNDAEVDTQSFCRDLLEAISPQMSRHDMRNLELAIRHSRIQDKDPALQDEARAKAFSLVEALKPLLTRHLTDAEAGFNSLKPELVDTLVDRLLGKD